MATDLTLMRLASAMARHASARHEVIAHNVANADTPGFKAMDLPSFAEAYAQDAVRGRRLDFRAKEDAGATSAPNGNSVAIEEQMVHAVDAQAQHEAAMLVYRKTIDLLRLSMRTQR